LLCVHRIRCRSLRNIYFFGSKIKSVQAECKGLCFNLNDCPVDAEPDSLSYLALSGDPTLMIKNKLTRAGATVLPLALFAVIGITGGTDNLSQSTPSTTKQNLDTHVCNRVHSAAATAEKAAPTGQLLAQRSVTSQSFGSTGQDYLDQVSEEGIYHWPAEKLPIKVYIEDGRHVPGYRANMPQVLCNGFDAWVHATNGKLGWVRVNNKSQADLVASFTDVTPELTGGTEAGRTKTFTKFDTEKNEGLIYKATMTLATRLPERELSDQEITKTFMHEAGHAFGIAGHSPNRADIMCAKVNHGQQPVLSAADKATIVRLYGNYPTCAQAGLPSSSRSM
jgi:predicted Zn-dependent protease